MHCSSCTIACGLHRQGGFQAADRRALSSRNLSTMQSSSPIVFLVPRCGNASTNSVLFLVSLVSRTVETTHVSFFFRLFLRLSPKRRLTSFGPASSHRTILVGFETSFSSPWRRLVAPGVVDDVVAAVVAPTWTMQATKMANVRSNSFLGTSMKRTQVTWTAPARATRVLEVRAAGKEAGVGVYGTKAGMTQVFTRKGNAVPVTVISLGEGNYVTQVRETDLHAKVVEEMDENERTCNWIRRRVKDRRMEWNEPLTRHAGCNST